MTQIKYLMMLPHLLVTSFILPLLHLIFVSTARTFRDPYSSHYCLSVNFLPLSHPPSLLPSPSPNSSPPVHTHSSHHLLTSPPPPYPSPHPLNRLLHRCCTHLSRNFELLRISRLTSLRGETTYSDNYCNFRVTVTTIRITIKPTCLFTPSN